MKSKTRYPARLSRILSAADHEKDRAAAAVGSQLTLFGFDTSVSLSDREIWISTHAPRLSRLHWPTYIADYNVDDKIRRAKRAGKWPPVAPASFAF